MKKSSMKGRQSRSKTSHENEDKIGLSLENDDGKFKLESDREQIIGGSLDTSRNDSALKN
jgi:hypothetical protein